MIVNSYSKKLFFNLNWRIEHEELSAIYHRSIFARFIIFVCVDEIAMGMSSI